MDSNRRREDDRKLLKNLQINPHNFINGLKDIGHYGFLKSIPLKTEMGTCIITHAGIVTGKSESDVLFNRRIPYKLNKPQVLDHAPSPKAIYEKGYYKILTQSAFIGESFLLWCTSRGSCQIISTVI